MPTPPACRSFDLVELSSDPATISILPLASHKHHTHLSSSTGLVPLLGVIVLLTGVPFPDVPCTCVHRGGLNPSAYSTPALPSPQLNNSMTRGTQPLHSLCFFFYIPPLVRPRCELQLSGCPIGVSWDVPAAVVFPKTPLPDASLSLQATRDAYQQHLKITELRGT
jgi:hypothetical protein